MSYKTILVHADPTPQSDRRLKLALRVANLFDASLIGVGAEAFDPMVITAAGCGVADGVVLDAVRQRIEMDLPAAEKRFRGLCSGRHGDRWMACQDYPAKMLALEARR
jgi:nucleotide-binding universal stress UspA family protein